MMADPTLRLVAPDGPFPPMSVLELALAQALTRESPHALGDVRKTLSDWFRRSVSDADIKTALAHMERQGWMQDHGCNGPEDMRSWLLTEEGVEVVTQLYGGSIRMIDRGVDLKHLLALLDALTDNQETDNDR